MAHKHFYTHIVTIDSVRVLLDGLHLTVEEKEELLAISEENLHYVVMDTVLTQLTPEDKKTLLEHMSKEDHETIWQLLHEKTEGIEEKIKQAAEEFLATLHADIHEAKKLSKE